MSTRYNRYNPKSGCFHENTIHDQHTATIVCLMCNVVLEENLPYTCGERTVRVRMTKELINITKDHPDKRTWDRYLTRKIDNLAFRTPLDFILDVGELWHMTENDTNVIYRTYQKHVHNLIIIKNQKWKPEELLGYTLYQHVIKNDFAYTLDDIMYILNKTDSRFISLLQNELNENIGPHLQTITNKICTALNLNSSSKLFIGKLCRKYRKKYSLQQPKTFCTLIILWFCRFNYPKYSDSFIIKKANANRTHIKKLEKQLKSLQNEIVHECNTFLP